MGSVNGFFVILHRPDTDCNAWNRTNKSAGVAQW